MHIMIHYTHFMHCDEANGTRQKLELGCKNVKFYSMSDVFILYSRCVFKSIMNKIEFLLKHGIWISVNCDEAKEDRSRRYTHFL